MITTPLDVWPIAKHRGRPGYSAGHFAALAGTQDSPLLVAERIADRIDADRIYAAAKLRLAHGDEMGEVMDWQTQEVNRLKWERWGELCTSFDAVIEMLEHSKHMPGIKPMLAAAKRAKQRYQPGGV